MRYSFGYHGGYTHEQKKQIFIWKFKAEQSLHILHNAFILSYSHNDNESQVGRADFSLILQIGSYIFEKNDLSIKNSRIIIVIIDG